MDHISIIVCTWLFIALVLAVIHSLDRQRLNCLGTKPRSGINMKVTSVKVYSSKEDIVRAYVDITLNDCWAIRGLKVIRHPTGLFVVMPRKKGLGGTPSDVAFPITREARKMIEEAVMAEYRKVIAEVK